MKVKSLPEDFQVEELTDFAARGGQFALYRLVKRSIGTPEAIDELLRRWRLERERVSYGGLKDRHAVTQQYVTVRNGPKRDLHEKSISLTYLGQAAGPFGPQEITGNRFRITLRNMKEEDARTAAANLQQVALDGLPNYFDDQRFGSLGYSGEFIAKPWCLGDYERVIWLALADPNPHDRPDDREQKRILRDNWGKWTLCKATLARSNRRSIITFLDDRPGDFRGAVGRLRIDLRSLWLAAYQSALWNRILAAWIRQTCRPEQLHEVPLRLGNVPFFHQLEPAQRPALLDTTLPLPSARIKLEPGPVADVVQTVLAAEGMELRQLRVKYPRDSFFSKGWRTAAFVPKDVTHKIEPDEMQSGRMKLRMGFDLPRGTYATILIKRITGAGDDLDLDDPPSDDAGE